MAADQREDTLVGVEQAVPALRLVRRVAHVGKVAVAEAEVRVRRARLAVPGPEVAALDRATGEVDWSYQVMDFISLPALTGEQLYVVTRVGGKSQLRALNLADGQEIWQVENMRLSNAAPVVAGGQVYVRTVDGSVLSYN